MNSLIRSIRQRLTRRPDPPCDSKLRVGSLLVGDPGESVVLPFLPGVGGGANGIEFAAASTLERVALGALVRREGARRIFEIGTFRGVTAVCMARNASAGAQLWTLDLPPELSPAEVADRYYSSSPNSGFRAMARAGASRNVGAALHGYDGECQIEQIFGDSAEFDFASVTPIDLFFVDGCHEYASALRDTRSAWSALKPGGLIVWHDYNWESVHRAVSDAALQVPITWIEETSLAFARRPPGIAVRDS